MVSILGIRKYKNVFWLAAKARLSDIRSSFKNMYETWRSIKWMNLLKAEKYLRDVI